MSLFERLGRRALFCLDPETAHGLSIKALSHGPRLNTPAPPDQRLAVDVCGLTFRNPLGMAAGYDKNGEAPDALLALGFGFAEVGTVTPLPQAGTAKPRIFRLPADAAVINRLGFNNEGHTACEKRLLMRHAKPGIVGVNIGANKDSADRAGDYAAGVARFSPLASYLTINISSPNTPGLRSMQAREILADLLSRVAAAREASARRVPILLKIAPDLDDKELADIAEQVLTHRIDGVIVSNTTLERSGLRSERARETGGLSGRPLFERSTMVLARMRRLLGPEIALIGVGGIDSADAALQKIMAGADLVQLYTAMIYAGPGLPARIVRDLSQAMDRLGAKNLRSLRDTRTEDWADRQIES